MEEYLKEAEQCVENVVTSEEAMILADVQLWTYIVKHENICKQVSHHENVGKQVTTSQMSVINHDLRNICK